MTVARAPARRIGGLRPAQPRRAATTAADPARSRRGSIPAMCSSTATRSRAVARSPLRGQDPRPRSVDGAPDLRASTPTGPVSRRDDPPAAAADPGAGACLSPGVRPVPRRDPGRGRRSRAHLCRLDRAHHHPASGPGAERAGHRRGPGCAGDRAGGTTPEAGFRDCRPRTGGSRNLGVVRGEEREGWMIPPSPSSAGRSRFGRSFLLFDS